MLFDFSNVGGPTAGTAIPPAFKSSGADAEFTRELTLKLGHDDAHVRAEPPKRDDVARDDSEPAVETDEVETAEARDDTDAEEAVDETVRDDDGNADQTARTETSPDDIVLEPEVQPTPSDATAEEQAVSEGETTPTAEPVTVKAEPANTPTVPTTETATETSTTTDDSLTQVPKTTDKAVETTEVAETASKPLQPQVTSADVPQSEEALLAALESILGPDAQALLEAAAQPAGDELPGVLNLPEGFAALGGEPALIAHMLMKRVNALQQRIDRLQQLLQAQPAGKAGAEGASLDPAMAGRLGFADNTTVNDVISGLIRHTEARLDAVLNANARAAANPAALAGDGARPGGTANGSFASHLSGDAVTSTNSSSTSQNAAAQNAATLAARAAPPQTAAGIQVAIHLARAVQDGVDRINIRLNPAELGRVDVKLEVGHDGRALAVVTADRQETLDLLQRDARGLERALQEAGLRADSGSLSFNLRQHGQDAGQMAGGNPTPGGGAAGGSSDEQADAAATPTVDPNRLLDISV